MYSENAIRASCHVMIRPAERALYVIALLGNIFEADAQIGENECKLVGTDGGVACSSACCAQHFAASLS